MVIAPRKIILIKPAAMAKPVTDTVDWWPCLPMAAGKQAIQWSPLKGAPSKIAKPAPKSGGSIIR